MNRLGRLLPCFFNLMPCHHSPMHQAYSWLDLSKPPPMPTPEWWDAVLRYCRQDPVA
jgi:hypothetical protein